MFFSELANASEAFKGAQAIAGMQLSSDPHVVDSRFAWGDLPGDMQDSILGYTATSFAVESHYPIHLRFSEVGWSEVLYVARYEFKLLARNLKTGPEIEFTLTRFLDPAFKQARLFIESDGSMQEMLENNFNFKETFSSISAVRLEMRSEGVWLFQFVQTSEDGTEHVFKTPFWSRVERNTIEEMRERLETMFRMEFN